MLNAFSLLLGCQLAGEIIVRAAGLPVPGPLLGLVLLVLLLALRSRRGGSGPDAIDQTLIGRTAAGLIGILGLLFVPAGVGVVQHLALIEAHWLALSATLVASTLLTLLVTVLTFAGVARVMERRRDG